MQTEESKPVRTFNISCEIGGMPFCTLLREISELLAEHSVHIYNNPVGFHCLNLEDDIDYRFNITEEDCFNVTVNKVSQR